jgi:hypothetical protein
MLTKTTTSAEQDAADGAMRKQIIVTYSLWGIAIYRKIVDIALIHQHGPALLP